MKMEETMYSISQLSNALWFPAKRTKIMQLISSGLLKAVNTNPKGEKPVWYVSETEAKKFIISLTQKKI